MTNAFVPVDLDKLLDDFEEQDSFLSPASRERRSLVNDQGYSPSGCSMDANNIVEIPSGSGFSNKTDFPVNGLVTKGGSKENHDDIIANTVPNLTLSDKLNHTKPVIDLLSTDVNVCKSMSVDDNFKHNEEVKHTNEPGHKDFQNHLSSDNLVDLTDVAVTSGPPILNNVDLLGNVGPHSDPVPPDITNGITDKRTSHKDLVGDMSSGDHILANNLHQDLLLLDIDDPIHHSENSNFSQTFPHSKTAQDRIQGPGGNLISMTSANSSSQIDTENSLIDLTTDDTRPEIPTSSVVKVNNKGQNLLLGDNKRCDMLLADTANEELRSHHDFSCENSQTTTPKQTLMDQTPVASDSMGSPPGAVRIDTSSVSDSHNNDHMGNGYNQAFDDNTQGAVSNAPRLTQEGESLLFMQDHFANPDRAGDTAAVANTSVAVTDVNCTPGTNDSRRNDDMNDNTQTTPAESIPVGQDAVAEESNGPPSMVNSYEVLESEESFQLGYSPPSWVPDNSVQRCTSCQAKFTVVKRRHHCRACGKIYCSSCCNLKFNLQYLEDKLARVCQACANVLLQRQAVLANQNTPVSDCDEAGMYLYLNPEHPEAPIEQAPSQEVEDVLSRGEPPPEYEETESQAFTPVEVASVAPVFDEDTVSESTPQVTQFRPTTCSSSSSMSSADIPVTSTVPLPPLLRKTNEGLKIDESPNHQELLYLLKKRKETVTFLLNKNLVVRVKIVKLNCCVKRKCWCFSSEGMQTADQEDMVILLECVPKESSIPQDVLSHFNTAFAYAKQGHRVTDLGYTIFGQPFLGSLRNAGFLYVKSSFQCLDNLLLPSGPHIFGILIQREEVSWVQLFPIRLLLRLGAEYRYYPSPLWSVRDRDALYGDIGHTIMDLLADFKNFQYTLPRVTGMYVHLEDKKAVIQLPQNRYDEVLKVLNATDEYVMAFEATFSNVADSHLVCIQEGANYKTQCINIEGQERKVTGASFIVFNGALKTTTDVKAKVSVVEDGLMVQMIKQLSEEMRQAMREMSDFTIDTGCLDTDGASIQQVVFEWVSKRSPDTQSVLSPIDGLTLGMTSDIKINTHFDFSTPSIFRLRWTELFFLNHTGDRPARNLPAQFKQTTADIAKACTVALRPYLFTLYQLEKRRIGLRVNLSPDMVGYMIGSQGKTLPDEMATDLDNELVPAIHNAVNPSSSNTPSQMEFLFNIVEMLS